MLSRMVIWTLVFVASVTACKMKTDPRQITFYHRHDGLGVDPDIQDYVDTRTRPFLPKYFNVVLLDQISTPQAFALSRRESDNSYCEIEIHHGRWENLSQIRRRTLLYHEIGHCLGLEHIAKGEKVESIMYSRLLQETELRLLASNPPEQTDWISEHFLELFREEVLEQTRLFCEFDGSC